MHNQKCQQTKASRKKMVDLFKFPHFEKCQEQLHSWHCYLVFLIAFSLCSRPPNGNHHNHKHRKYHRGQDNSLMDKTKSQEQQQPSKRKEYSQHTNSLYREDLEPKDCCPSEMDMVELALGISRTGKLLEIYNGTVPQLFHEISCKPKVLNRPCQFIGSSWRNSSKCVQRYSYSYALVRAFADSAAPKEDWRLDYIRVRSGCSCEIGKQQPPR